MRSTGIFIVALLSAGVIAAQVTNLATSTYINTPRIAASGGYGIVVWGIGGQIVASTVSQAGVWSAPQPVSENGPLLQDVPAVAMGSDGTAIVAWRQVVMNPSYQSQVVTRRFAPNHGWDAIQVVSTLGVGPSVAIGPYGRAQIVYDEGPGFYARTLAPGSGVWGPATMLGPANYLGPAQLAVGAEIAYAAFSASVSTFWQQLFVATWDREGWHPAVALTPTGTNASGPQLAMHGNKGIVAWDESANGILTGNYIRRLPATDPAIVGPIGSCQYALGNNGEIAAACLQQGDPVPGCTDPTRGGPVQAYYVTVAAYLHELYGNWVPLGSISDVHKRASALQASGDSSGNTFVTWRSEVPCQTGSDEVLAQVKAAGLAQFGFVPEQLVAGPATDFYSAPNGAGLLRYSWTIIDSSGTLPVSNLYASFFNVGGSGWINSDSNPRRRP